jgi:hypothetical protein
MPTAPIAAGAPLDVCCSGYGKKTGDGVDVAGLAQCDGRSVRIDDPFVIRISPREPFGVRGERVLSHLIAHALNLPTPMIWSIRVMWGTFGLVSLASLNGTLEGPPHEEALTRS